VAARAPLKHGLRPRSMAGRAELRPAAKIGLVKPRVKLGRGHPPPPGASPRRRVRASRTSTAAGGLNASSGLAAPTLLTDSAGSPLLPSAPQAPAASDRTQGAPTKPPVLTLPPHAQHRPQQPRCPQPPPTGSTPPRSALPSLPQAPPPPPTTTPGPPAPPAPHPASPTATALAHCRVPFRRLPRQNGRRFRRLSDSPRILQERRTAGATAMPKLKPRAEGTP